MPVLLRVPWGGAKRTIDPSKLSPTLAENSWKMIARASEEGIASTLWKVGDEIDIVLSGDYKGSITMQIAGFGHDILATGGKAGITFLSKQVLSAEKMRSTYYIDDGWRETDMRVDIMPKIKNSLPDELQRSIKPVMKTSSANDGSGFSTCYTYTLEEDVFIPSLAEVLDVDDSNIKMYSSLYRDMLQKSLARAEGSMYAFFKTLDDIEKPALSGSAPTKWWTRSDCHKSGYSQFGIICRGADEDSYDVTMRTSTDKASICFGFCI